MYMRTYFAGFNADDDDDDDDCEASALGQLGHSITAHWQRRHLQRVCALNVNKNKATCSAAAAGRIEVLCLETTSIIDLPSATAGMQAYVGGWMQMMTSGQRGTS